MTIALDVARKNALEGSEQNAEYLQALQLIERLHRLLLDVIKDEFDRLGGSDINSVQALLLYNIGDSELTAGELEDPRLLSRVERILQSQEARRHGLHPLQAFGNRPALCPGEPDDKGLDVCSGSRWPL